MRVLKIGLKTLGVVATVYIASVLATQITTRSLITEVKSVQRTITEARVYAYEIELTGVTQQTLEYNKRLAKVKKWADIKILKYHYPQELKDIEFIK